MPSREEDELDNWSGVARAFERLSSVGAEVMVVVDHEERARCEFVQAATRSCRSSVSPTLDIATTIPSSSESTVSLL